MKTYWSAFPLLLLFLASCGGEDFGTAAKSSSSQADGLKQYEQLSCSSHTLIKPKVDILYVVDNSSSTYYVASDVRTSIANTVNSISKEFDYRVIGTSLLPIDSTPNNDYQVLTNSQDSLSSEAASRKVISASELNFFTTPVGGMETGLRRTVEFINANTGTGLFRQNAYLLIILVSNGRDEEVEYSTNPSNDETAVNQSVYNARLSSFNAIKSNLQSQQLRMFSVSAGRGCTTSGWRSSVKSYIQMSKDLYIASGATDSPSNLDSYNLCGGAISTLFTAVNNSIKQVLVPHVYKYWPITFAENNETVSLSEIQVYKISNNGSPTLMPSSSWTYKNIPGGVNTRIRPTVGEFVSGNHFVEFNSNSYITYPDCVQVKSVSRTEYFGYVVIPQEPVASSIVVRINGRDIPNSTTNGWSYLGNISVPRNIKVPYPAEGDQYPAVSKSGFMIQLNGSSNYYKSGESVEVFYTPQAI